MITPVFSVILLTLDGYRVINGYISVGDLIVLILLLALLPEPINDLVYASNEWTDTKVSLTRLSRIFYNDTLHPNVP